MEQLPSQTVETHLITTRRYASGFMVHLQTEDGTNPGSGAILNCSWVLFYQWCFAFENEEKRKVLQRNLHEQHGIEVIAWRYPPLLQFKSERFSEIYDLVLCLKDSLFLLTKDVFCHCVKENMLNYEGLEQLLCNHPQVQDRQIIVYKDDGSYYITGLTKHAKNVLCQISDLEESVGGAGNGSDGLKQMSGSGSVSTRGVQGTLQHYGHNNGQTTSRYNNMGRTGDESSQDQTDFQSYQNIESSGKSTSAGHIHHTDRSDLPLNIKEASVNNAPAKARQQVLTQTQALGGIAVGSLQDRGGKINVQNNLLGTTSQPEEFQQRNKQRTEGQEILSNSSCVEMLGSANTENISVKNSAQINVSQVTSINRSGQNIDRCSERAKLRFLTTVKIGKDGKVECTVQLNLTPLELSLCMRIIPVLPLRDLSNFSIQYMEDAVQFIGNETCVRRLADKVSGQLDFMLQSKHNIDGTELAIEPLKMMQNLKVFQFVEDSLRKRELCCYLEFINIDENVCIDVYTTGNFNYVFQTIQSCFCHNQIDVDQTWELFLKDDLIKKEIKDMEKAHSCKIKLSHVGEILHIWYTCDVTDKAECEVVTLKTRKFEYSKECKKSVEATDLEALVCNKHLQKEMHEIEEKFHVTFKAVSNRGKTGWLVKGPDGVLERACNHFRENVLANLTKKQIQVEETSRAYDQLFGIDKEQSVLNQIAWEQKCVVKEMPVNDDSKLLENRRQQSWHTMNGRKWTFENKKVTGIYCGEIHDSGCDVIVIAKPKMNITAAKETGKKPDDFECYKEGFHTVVNVMLSQQSKANMPLTIFGKVFHELNRSHLYRSVAVSLDVCSSVGWCEKQFMWRIFCEFKAFAVEGSLDSCMFFHQDEGKVEDIKKHMSKFLTTYAINFTEMQDNIIENIPREVNEPKAEKQKQIFLVQGILHHVAQKQKCDVVVNTTNSFLKLDEGAVSNSILEVAGYEMQQECYSRYPSGIKIGDFAITGGHKLACRHIFHGNFPYHNGDPEHKILKSLMMKCLEEVEGLGLSSIAFPAIGTGNLKYPRNQVAKEMYDVAKQYIKSSSPSSSLQRIFFVVYGPDVETYQAFGREKETFEKWFTTFQHGTTPTEQPDVMRGLLMRYGKVDLRVTIGGVADKEADVLAIFWTNQETYANKLKKTYFSKAGENIVATWKSGIPKMQKEKILVTDSGDLNFRKILHLMIDDTGLFNSVQSVFQWMKQNSMTSVLIPFQQTMDEFVRMRDRFVMAINSAMIKYESENQPVVKIVEVVVDKEILYKSLKEKIVKQNQRVVIGDFDDQGAVGGAVQMKAQQATSARKITDQQLSENTSSIQENKVISKPTLVILGLEKDVKIAEQKIIDVINNLNRCKRKLPQTPQEPAKQEGSFTEESNDKSKQEGTEQTGVYGKDFATKIQTGQSNKNMKENDNESKEKQKIEEQTWKGSQESGTEPLGNVHLSRSQDQNYLTQGGKQQNIAEMQENAEQQKDKTQVNQGQKTQVTQGHRTQVNQEQKTQVNQGQRTQINQEQKTTVNQEQKTDKAQGIKEENMVVTQRDGVQRDINITEDQQQDEGIMPTVSDAVDRKDFTESTGTAVKRVKLSKTEEDKRRVIFRSRGKNLPLHKQDVEKELERWKQDWNNSVEVLVCPFRTGNEAMLRLKSSEDARQLTNEFNSSCYQICEFPTQMVVNLKATINKDIILKAKQKNCMELLKDVYKRSGAQLNEDLNEAWLEGSLQEIRLGLIYLAEIVQKEHLGQTYAKDYPSCTEVNVATSPNKTDTEKPERKHSAGNDKAEGSSFIVCSRWEFEEIDFFESKCLNQIKAEWHKDGASVTLSGDIILLMEAKENIKKYDTLNIDDVTDNEFNKMKSIIAGLKADKIWCYRTESKKMIIRGKDRSRLLTEKNRLLEACGRLEHSTRKYRMYAPDTPTPTTPTSEQDMANSPFPASHIVEKDTSNALPNASLSTLKTSYKENQTTPSPSLGLAESCSAASCDTLQDWNTNSRSSAAIGSRVMLTKNKISVYVYSGNLLELDVDCIVNATDAHASLEGGISAVISKAAGPKLKEDCEAIIKRKKYLSVGESFSTTAGNLPYRFVIHTYGPSKNHYWVNVDNKCEKDLGITIKNCLQEAHTLRMRSVGIPAISSGYSDVPLKVCAEGYIQGVRTFAEANAKTSLKEIHFVLLENSAVDTVKQAFVCSNEPAQDRSISIAQGGAVEGAQYPAAGQGAKPKVPPYRSKHLSQQYPYRKVSSIESTYFWSTTMSVVVYTGDITFVKCDAIAMFDNDLRLSCDGSDTGHLGKKEKNVLFREEILSTGTGIKKILHCRITAEISRERLESAATCLKACYGEILQKLDTIGFKSVALPVYKCVISTTYFGSYVTHSILSAIAFQNKYMYNILREPYDFSEEGKEKLALAIRDAVLSFSDNQSGTSNLRSIHIVNTNQAYTDLMKRQFDIYTNYMYKENPATYMERVTSV